MKRNIFTILFTLCFGVCIFSQKKPIRVIVRGGDIGYAHSGNEALIKAFKEGIENSIEVIVPHRGFLKQCKC
jgi:hypothetical protein